MTAPPTRKKWRTTLAIFSALFIFFFLACSGLSFLIEFVFHLLAGWFLFIGKMPGSVEFSSAGIVTGVVCIAAFVAGFHWIVRTRVISPISQGWRLVSSLTAGVFVLLLFTAGICIVGMAHQCAWLMSSEDPVLESSWRQYMGARNSRNNMKQIGLAMHKSADDHDDAISTGLFSKSDQALHSWQTQILPEVEQTTLFESIDLSKPWNADINLDHFKNRIEVFESPLSRDQMKSSPVALSSYALNSQLMTPNQPLHFEDISDGASSTILLGEVFSKFRPWGDPLNVRDPAVGFDSQDGFGYQAEFGVNFVFADGSARLLNKTISSEILKALSTPHAGEMVSNEDF